MVKLLKELKKQTKATMTKNKMDFENELEYETSRFLKTFENFILNGFGERCETNGIGCEICKIWCIYDLLKLFLI